MSQAALSDEESVLDTDDVREVLKAFSLELGDRLNAHEIERILTDDEDNLTSADLGTRPESFTETHLIYPLLEAAGLEYEPRPFGQSGGRAVWPDFELTNIEAHTIGEDKPLNNVEEAIPEIKEYLDRKSIDAEYGIATDGIVWYIFRIELGGDFTEYPEIKKVDLRPALIEVARDSGVVDSTSVSDVDVEEVLDAFVAVFDRPKLETLLSQTAPKTLRDERKRDIEAFYELYIELLFGESDEYDYETCLMDDIRSPKDAPERDERLFGITLMNRLLFIKFLESRDILDDGFLRDRVDHYERHEQVMTGNLYETQIKPLFYKLLNTQEDDRERKYRSGWFANVPYLNGGLFRENVTNEFNYTVIDRILPTVISDLIEGSQLDLNGSGFDPAILGSVFEKTITHIEQEREQKDTGAYYTPNDVTDIVSRNAIDPKIRDVLIETFVEVVPQDDDQATVIRGQLDEMELTDILEAVEEGRSWFATPEAIEKANERLSTVKVLDPACGSGHFLTSAMDEVYRAQLSLQRGLSHGDTPDAETRFNLKRELALSGIYGVDADRIATEIGKLRVWLKIVEDNGWSPEFGKLPNIDVNIIDGNSLIGLPIKGMTDVSLDFADVEEEIEEILELRKQYKNEEAEDRTEIEQLEEEIRPVLNSAYVDQLNYTVDEKYEEADGFREFCNSIQDTHLHRKLVSIKIEREDGDALSDDNKDDLGDLGFEWQDWRDTNKSASLDVEEREQELWNDDDTDDPQEALIDELTELLSDGYVFSKVERRPVEDDLNSIFGSPFHWAAEFPEANSEENGSLSVDFDIIVGNPPYGDLLSESEDALTATYRTAGEDIAALFVERQLQLLSEDGYFGNVTTLKLVYKRSMEEIQDYLQETLEQTNIACFAKRPSKVFEGAEVRIAIISGKKSPSDGEGNIFTSEFIRFDNDADRDTRFRNITYRNTDGYTLTSEGIDGEGRHVALAKVGLEHIENILQKLKEEGSLIKEREADSNTNHVIWRRRGMDYFTNPMYEKLYDGTDIKGIYFDSELEARTAFLGISSSIFYVYWCTYGDMFHLNLSEIRGFPLPEVDELEKVRDEIEDISDRLWDTMEDGFNSDIKNFDNYEMQKPIIEEADEVMGELYGLSEEEISFVQNYHAEYGRHGPDDSQLSDY